MMYFNHPDIETKHFRVDRRRHPSNLILFPSERPLRNSRTLTFDMESPLATIMPVLQAIRATRLVYVATFTLAWWDYLLTLQGEIQHFWFDKWSIPKALFFANRYTILISLSVEVMGTLNHSVSDNFCVWFVLFVMGFGKNLSSI